MVSKWPNSPGELPDCVQQTAAYVRGCVEYLELLMESKVLPPPSAIVLDTAYDHQVAMVKIEQLPHWVRKMISMSALADPVS